MACSDESFKSLSGENYIFSYNGFEKNLKLNNKNENFILAFFTKECGVCKEQIKILQALLKKYDFKIFVVLGDAKNLNDAKIWASKKDLNLPLFYEKNSVKYLSSAVGGIYGVPVLSFFKNSKMSEKFIGLTSYKILENELKKFGI